MNLSDWLQTTVLTGSSLVAIPVAMTAGLVSFFSPCVVPLLPGYLSYTTGLSGTDLESGSRWRVVAGSSLFVLGFTALFVSYGALFGRLGGWLYDYKDELTTVMGGLTILVGLAFLGWLPWFGRDVRVHRVPAVGLAAAPFLGFLFALGWSPCIGPTLSAVMSLALNEASATRGAVLAAFYCLGLGLPFIAAAVAFRKMVSLIGFVRRNQVWVSRLGGGMLIVVGVLLFTGVWDSLIGELRYWASGFDATL